MTINIEQGVPIPQTKKEIGIAAALRALNVGDSFIIPAAWNLASVRSCAYSIKGRRFTFRQSPGGGEFRVWRVALPDDDLPLA